MPYKAIKNQTVSFFLSLETKNMEFSDPSSQPPLSDSDASI